MCDTKLTLPRPNILHVSLHHVPSSTQTINRQVLRTSVTSCQPPIRVFHHYSTSVWHTDPLQQHHYSTTLDLPHWTRLASLRGNDWSSALVSSRGRNHKSNNGSRTSSNTRLNLQQFKSVFLPVSVRQLNLPNRSVKQVVFLPQMVRFYHVIYENPPDLRQTNSLERVSSLRQNCNRWRRSAARRKRGCLEAWQCTW